MKPKWDEADQKMKDNGSREGLFRTVTVGQQKYKGLHINCAETECVFEFKAYKFNPDGYDSGKRKHQAPRTAAPIVEADCSSPLSLVTPLNIHPSVAPQGRGHGKDCRPSTSDHKSQHTRRQRVPVLSKEEGVPLQHDSIRHGKPPTDTPL